MVGLAKGTVGSWTNLLLLLALLPSGLGRGGGSAGRGITSYRFSPFPVAHHLGRSRRSQTQRSRSCAGLKDLACGGVGCMALYSCRPWCNGNGNG